MSDEQNSKALVLGIIAQRLASLEKAPGTWAITGFGLEGLFMQLVELRQAITRPAALQANPRETRDAWIYFVCAVNGSETNRFLASVLRAEGMEDMLPRLLGDAARWIAREYPPE